MATTMSGSITKLTSLRPFTPYSTKKNLYAYLLTGSDRLDHCKTAPKASAHFPEDIGQLLPDTPTCWQIKLARNFPLRFDWHKDTDRQRYRDTQIDRHWHRDKENENADAERSSYFQKT